MDKRDRGSREKDREIERERERERVREIFGLYSTYLELPKSMVISIIC